MDETELTAALEGILFAAGEPVDEARLALVLDLPQEKCRELLTALADRCSFERRGIRILRMENSWQMCSAPEYAALIRRVLERRKPPQLSQSALEALSVVAYYQPTTRTYVDQIRGVDSSYTMGLLQERGLIEECGRLEVPGRPILFRTTPLFLRSFGLNSLEDLPELPDQSSDGTEETGAEPTAPEEKPAEE